MSPSTCGDHLDSSGLNFGPNNNRCHNLVQSSPNTRGLILLLSHKKPFYKRSTLRFHCTGCGKCCYGNPGSHYIAASGVELEQIRQHLRLSRDWFLRHYTEALPQGNRGIRINDKGACPFLLDGQCGIYRLRPSQCRSYPFWPEIVDSQKGWQAESQRCEGINWGEIVPLKRIEQQRTRCGD